MAKVSRDVILEWLEGYHALQQGETPLSDRLGITGSPKPDDGIRGGLLNRIMLDAALAALAKQEPVMFFILRARYIEQMPVKVTLSALSKAGRSVSAMQYYGISKKGVDFVWDHINGRHRGLELLAKKLTAVT